VLTRVAVFLFSAQVFFFEGAQPAKTAIDRKITKYLKFLVILATITVWFTKLLKIPIFNQKKKLVCHQVRLIHHKTEKTIFLVPCILYIAF